MTIWTTDKKWDFMDNRALAALWDDPILRAASDTFDKLLERVRDEHLRIDLLEQFERAVSAAGWASIEAGRL